MSRKNEALWGWKPSDGGEPPSLPQGEIRFIVRNRHVGLTDRELMRELLAYFPPIISKFNRRRVYLYALAQHHENQGLCREFRL